MSNKKCFVPACQNTEHKCPGKIFVRIPEKMRLSWCQQADTPYYPVYTQYCCEDHFNPKDDLSNYMKHKLLKEEPKLKPTAVLRNVTSMLEHGENHPKRTGSSIVTTAKKRKLESSLASTSRYCPDKIKKDVATQCDVKMEDKSTNYKTRKPMNRPYLIEELRSPSTSGKTRNTPSLFGATSETEETSAEVTPMEKHTRKLILEIIFKKPKMYLGLPKSYLWLIKYIGEKSTPNINEFILICALFKIKQNISLFVMCDIFQISMPNISAMIFKGIECLCSFFQTFIYCPEPHIIKNNLPAAFKIRYSNVYMIIDCFEIQISKPCNPTTQAQTWSQYKNCNTLKYLIGCTPNGFVSFISNGYGGRISDTNIVKQCHLVDVLPYNAVILADRWFKEIEPLLSSRNIKLLRPPSVYAGVKQTLSETLKSKVIASLRVHVERVIRRLREFNIMKPHSVVNYKYVSFMDEIVVICCGLINLQGEIIKNT